MGVRPRLAPSTMAIMRSRKLLPGFEVMRTSSQSDSTRVPPVTELKSPSASRITGADSPVIADSSTDAIPLMTSPSPGIRSSVITITMSPARSSSDSHRVHFDGLAGSVTRLAQVVLRILRNPSAWARPRPSASASAKFAKSTVNHSQIATLQINPAEASPLPRLAWTASTVVRMLPIQTTNITGLRHCTRGDSL